MRRLWLASGLAVTSALGLIAFNASMPGAIIGLMAFGAGLLVARTIWRAGRKNAIWRAENRDSTALRGHDLEALDSAPLAIILIAPRGLVAFANRAATADFPGLKAGEPLSFGLRNPVVLEAVAACQRERTPQRTELIEKVPVQRSFSLFAAPLVPTGARGVPDTALYLQETSGQRRLEAMRSDFVANASHELRTPLASILGFVETLQGPAKDDGVAREKFLGIMATQARRMARLVDDLLSLSRIEMKEHLAPEGRVDVAALVDEAVNALSGLSGERGVVIAVDHAAGPLIVLGDRDDLLRVLDNLIENAIKYGRAGERVEIAVAERRSTLEAAISLRDFGPGIAPEHLPRLTERFYRVDATRSRAEGGTGLGLAIVKHIVNRHRGRLEIVSNPGEGACFTVVLPLAR